MATPGSKIRTTLKPPTQGSLVLPAAILDTPLSPRQDTFLQNWAFHYQEMGMSVIPLRDKIPIIKWSGFQKRSPEREEIKKWFRKKNLNGIGVVLGEVSKKLCVIDFDDQGDLLRWVKEHPDLAEILPRVMTHRGGHVYFRSKINCRVKFAGGEIIADSKHYVVLPPSLHPKGGRYEWQISFEKIENVPLFEGEEFIQLGLSYEWIKKMKNDSRRIAGTETLSRKKGNSYSSNSRIFSKISIHSEKFSEFPLEKSLPNEILWICRNHVPDREGKRNQSILSLVRNLKKLGTVTDDMSVFAFQYWWYLSKHVVGTKDRQVSLRDFLTAWDTCVTIVEELDVKKLISDTRNVEVDTGDWRTDRLLRCCIGLQEWHGGPFFLSGEDAGNITEVKITQGSYLLKKLVDKGFLTITRKPDYKSMRATYYSIAKKEYLSNK